MAKIVVTEPIHEAGMRLLRVRKEHEVVGPGGWPGAGEFLSAAAGAEALLVRTMPIGAEIIDRLDGLRIISKHGVGCDNIATVRASAKGAVVAIAADANASSVAEHTLMLMLMCAKRAAEHDRETRAGNFAVRENLLSGDLKGGQLLILGFGRIGREVARLALAFGMRVLAFDPFVDRDKLAEVGCEAAADWRAALPECGFVSLHLPLNGETRGMFGADEFARMKPDAVLINCARGGIVDENALHDALAEGRIAAAGLDVFAEEPAPAGHPLFGLANLAVTPHNAALTRQAAVRMATRAAQNILDYLDNGRLPPEFLFNAGPA